MSLKVVSPSAWLTARKELLVREKELSQARTRVNAARRALPVVEVTKDYTFDNGSGEPIKLLDLFEGRRQLIVCHFMFDPASEEGCPSCSVQADTVGHLSHLHARDTSYAAVSRAPWSKLDAFRRRMGWTFPWYSSAESTFNYDFHVTQDESVTPVVYNFMDKQTLLEKGMPFFTSGEQPGISVFLRGDVKEGQGDKVFHTYSTYSRGSEQVINTYNYLDLTPLGRGEDGPGGITKFRHHDKYDLQN